MRLVDGDVRFGGHDRWLGGLWAGFLGVLHVRCACRGVRHGVGGAGVQPMIVRPAFTIVIDNLRSIAAIYSDGVAGRVLHEVRQRVDLALGADVCSCAEEPWGVSLHLHAGVSRDGCIETVEEAVHVASLAPIEVCGVRVVVALRLDDGHEDSCRAIICDLSNVPQCRDDMEAAARAYAALAIGARLAEQSIAAPANSRDLLYRECLARLLDKDGSTIMPGAYLPALQRLGLTYAFDRGILRETIMQLRSRPEVVLGCNVSALSICDDGCWRSIVRDLARHPDLARRLVIEVTETVAPPNVSKALTLIETLRTLGCRVALDDFGSGWTSIAFARAVRPDIIKIDGSYVRDAVRHPAGQALLSHMVGLSLCLGGEVVVEGVEDEQMLAAAMAAGAPWLQGHVYGQPTVPARVRPADIQTRLADVVNAANRFRRGDENTSHAERS